MKSRSLAKWAFEMAMRSMMGVTCSARDRGCVSLSQSVALNLGKKKKKDRQCSVIIINVTDLRLLCLHQTSALCLWARRGVRCPGHSGWTPGWSIPRLWWPWGCEDWHTGTRCSDRNTHTYTHTEVAVSVCERMNEIVCGKERAPQRLRYPVVSRVLLCNPQEGLKGSLWAWEKQAKYPL